MLMEVEAIGNQIQNMLMLNWLITIKTKNLTGAHNDKVLKKSRKFMTFFTLSLWAPEVNKVHGNNWYILYTCSAIGTVAGSKLTTAVYNNKLYKLSQMLYLE